MPPPSPLLGVKVLGLTACGFCENSVENGGAAGDEYMPEYPAVAVDAECPAILETMAGFA